VEKDFHLEIKSRRRENRDIIGGFQSEEATWKCCVLQSLLYRFSIHVRGSQWTKLCTYASHQKANHVHLEKHAILVCTTGHTLPGLFAVVFVLVSHYPCYRRTDFSIIKSFLAMVFPRGFFQGYLPKNIGVYVSVILVFLFCFHCIFH
jgi:hypothetical protein